mgnify:CR=1 FL=1
MEDNIPYYPDLTKNDAQKVLNVLAEFKELMATIDPEPRATPGTYYRAQDVVARILRILKRLFVIWEPGTGKSCTITDTFELVKELTSLYDKFIIITHSSLKDEMKFQVICKCTDNKYINDKGRTGVAVDVSRKSSLESFKDNYDINSYDEFHKKIKGKTAKELVKDFSYSFIALDEVTKLINVKFSTSKPLNNKNGSITWIETISNDILILKEISDGIVRGTHTLDDPRIIDSDIMYIQCWRLFHALGDLITVIIASATPATNRPSEINMLANLLLKIDNQIDIELFANNVFVYNLKKYEKYYNGLFSFVKSSSIVPDANYKGMKMSHDYIVEFPKDDISENPEVIVKKYDSQNVIYKIELYGYQAEKLFTVKDENANNKINNQIDQMLCYVDYTKNFGESASENRETLKALAHPGINGLRTRMNSSGLFQEIVRIEIDALKKSKLDGKPGPHVCFNYIPLTETVVGSIKETFRSNGFDILEDFSIFKKSNSNYCSVNSVTFNGLMKKPRAVFLVGKMDVVVRNQILQLANSPDNMYGEYIQFLDGSKVMGIGVNTKNVMRFIRPVNEWNEATEKQSRDRVFRNDGYDAIRNKMADDEEKKTGIRPDPYKFDLSVDVYNMCSYVRYFYVSSNYVKYFPESFKKIETTPFRSEKKYENGKYNVSIPSYHFDKIPNETQYVIDHENVIHIIGFCKTGEGLNSDFNKQIQHKQIMEFCKNDQVPHEEITKITGINIDIDLGNFTNNTMDIITCMSGIIYVFNITDDIIKMLENKVFIHHENCNFMKNYNNDVFGSEFNLIILNRENVSTVPKVAIKDVDYKIIPLTMEYYSPTEKGYILLESKSFGTRRLLHIAKRFAVDCINNYHATYNIKSKDGSIDCDYEECKYKCSSEVLTDNKSNDSYLYEDSEGNYDSSTVQWTNYEVLYSKKNIDSCQEDIIKMFTNKSDILISDIYKKLLPIYKRENFIGIAIYKLAASIHKINDNFGFDCYITKGEDNLFLTRDFPQYINNNERKSGNYVEKLIAITSEPDYRSVVSDVEKHIIDDIENIQIPSNLNEEELNPYINYIISKTSKLKIYNIIKLIENCLGRIAYSALQPNEFKNVIYNEKPVDSVICGSIFPIRCFKSIGSDGIPMFFHNQPEIFIPGEQGKIAKIKNASDPFKIFSIQNSKPTWTHATPQKTVELKNIAKSVIESKIINTVTLNINGMTFISEYYISYYEGVYRLVNTKNGSGESLKTLKPAKVRSLLTWIRNSQLMYIDGNAQKVNNIEMTSSTSSKKELRDAYIIDFFKYNNIIVHYSIMNDESVNLQYSNVNNETQYYSGPPEL